MARKSVNVLTGEVIEAVSLDELCRSCGVQSTWIVELIDEGILEPEGVDPSTWRFSAISITRTRIAWRLHQDLGVNRPGIAVALDLLDQRRDMHVQLQRLLHGLEGEDRD